MAKTRIKWSKYIPSNHKPTAKQKTALLLLENGTKELLFGGALGGGKHIPLGEYIEYIEGKTLCSKVGKVKDVKVGDFVYGSNGKPTEVLAISEPTLRPNYKITFDDNSSINSGDTHNWTVFDLSQRKQGDKERGNFTRVMTTEELYNSDLKYRDQRRYAIPLVSSPIEPSKPTIPIVNPYMLGYWLGNGCKQASTLTCHTDDVDEILDNLHKETGRLYEHRIYDDTAHRAKILTSGWVVSLRELGYVSIPVEAASKTYYIFDKAQLPFEWQTWSSEDRASLLAGLLDSDGHCNVNGGIEFTSTLIEITRLVQQLMRSLGCKPTQIYEKDYTHKGWENIFIVTCVSPQILFRLERKAVRQKTKNLPKKMNRRYITKVVKTKPEKGICYVVAATDSLYVVGKEYIVTHNSDFLLMCCLQYMDVPGYASGIFRKQLTDLKQPGALLDRAHKWLSPWRKEGVRYVPSDHAYKFPTINPDGTKGEDAQLVFCYLNDTNAKDRYQSSEYQTIAFDEISQWETDADYSFMTTRLRRTTCTIHGKNADGTPKWTRGCPECELKKSIPVRLVSASNPGGLGGVWVKNRFQIIPDPTIYSDKRMAIDAAYKGIRVPFIGTHPERRFVASYIDDNPHLDLKDYEQFLDNLDTELKSQLKDGNWEARSDSRFKRHHVRYYEIYDHAIRLGEVMHPMSYFKIIFSTLDFASTTDEGLIDHRIHRKAPSFTVISTWGINHNNDLFWLDMVRFRDEVPVIVEEGVNVYRRWKPQYFKCEFNGIGAGPSQYLKKLGIPIMKNIKSVDKLENSTAAMLLMKNGKIYFPINAPWIETAEDEVFTWVGIPSETDDIIDTLSDAANEIGPDAAMFALDNTTESIAPLQYRFNKYPSSHLTPPILGMSRTSSPFVRNRK